MAVAVMNKAGLPLQFTVVISSSWAQFLPAFISKLRISY